MLTRVGEVDLADIPQMEPVRRDLLGRALGFYREIPPSERGDRLSACETGRASAGSGDIHEMLGLIRPGRGRLPRGDRPPGACRGLGRRPRGPAGPGQGPRRPGRPAQEEQPVRRVRGRCFRPALRRPQGPGRGPRPTTVDDRRGLAATRYQLGTLLARLKDRRREDEAAYRAGDRGAGGARRAARRPAPRTAGSWPATSTTWGSSSPRGDPGRRRGHLPRGTQQLASSLNRRRGGTPRQPLAVRPGP